MLREARYRFNKAISFEKEERLFLCHVGLAICHKGLSDHSNFKISLLQACKVRIVSLDPIEIGRFTFELYFGMLNAAFTPTDNPKILEEIFKKSRMSNRMSKLTAEQKKIREYLSNIDT